MKLADWLRETQTRPTDLAARLKVHHTTIYRVASGKKRASLALALGISRETDGRVTAADVADAFVAQAAS